MRFGEAHDAKNQKLKADRSIGFEEVVFLIGHGHVLDILEHPNQQRYGGQRIFVVQRDNYVSSCHSSKTTSWLF